MLNVAFSLLAGTTVCAALGTLPPVSEDCQQLVNSITILNGQIGMFLLESIDRVDDTHLFVQILSSQWRRITSKRSH